MKHHPIFNDFSREKCVGTGHHIFDFLGVATDVAFKKGLEKFSLESGKITTPQYPPVNEHYFDWIALLLRVKAASGTFRMAELGAGWAPWLVRGAFAVRQQPAINNVELLGVEADETHFRWVNKHISDNDLNPECFHILHGAIAQNNETLKFPKLANPEIDYGASLRSVNSSTEFIEVSGVTLDDVFDRFSGALDFLHVDIQGAEYDVLPSAMPKLKETVKAIMIGTHISSEKHSYLRNLFLHEEWSEVMAYPRNEIVNTEFGEVQFGDGFLYFENPDFS